MKNGGGVCIRRLRSSEYQGRRDESVLWEVQEKQTGPTGQTGHPPSSSRTTIESAVKTTEDSSLLMLPVDVEANEHVAPQDVREL